jgi:cyclase
MTPRSRRAFLEAALGTAVALPFLARAEGDTARIELPEQPKRPQKFTAEARPLAPNLWILDCQYANVIALSGPEGALLVDGASEDHSRPLLKLALRTTDAKRVHTLFNTHWHPECIGLNERVGKAGARIIAHENTKLWLSRRITLARWPEPFEAVPPQARPGSTFYTTAELAFGDEQIDYGHLGQAHTDGDIYVRFRKANVLASGGLLYRESWPLLDWETGGWMGGLVGGIDRLIKLADEKTRIVPDYGALLRRADLQAQRAMFFTIYDRLVKSLTKGLGPEEAVALAPAKEFEAQFGPSQTFVTAAFRSLWGHFAPDA